MTNNIGGSTFFTGNSSANNATVVNNFGGILDLSGHNGSLAIGAVSGAGNIFLGGNNLTTGGLNTSTTISGVISDGGLFGGVGGSLTKSAAVR